MTQHDIFRDNSNIEIWFGYRSGTPLEDIIRQALLYNFLTRKTVHVDTGMGLLNIDGSLNYDEIMANPPCVVIPPYIDYSGQ